MAYNGFGTATDVLTSGGTPNFPSFQPADNADNSSTATNSFGSLTLGATTQNTLGYEILVNVSIDVTAAAGATIVLGVGPSTPPVTNAVTDSFTTSGQLISLSAIVPAGYYILVDTTGSPTIAATTTQVCPL